MANRLKQKTPPPPNPDKLSEDKVEQVSVTEVVKDERTTKIMGVISLLLSLFLFVAFTSYLFTWQEDQDKVHQFGIKIFSTDDVRVNNLLGVLGAYVAHVFIYNGFGIASYLFCTLFFVIGINLLFEKKVFSVVRNIRYVIAGLLVISMTAAFATKGNEFSWGGAVGELLNSWFVKWIGNFGTAALLLIAVVSYLVWRFNPKFTWPEKKPKTIIAKAEDEKEFIKAADEQPVYGEWNMQENEEGGKLFIHDEVEQPLSNNKLKNDDNKSIVLSVNEIQETTNPLTEFSISEKDNLSKQELEDISQLPLDVNEKELQVINENEFIEKEHEAVKEIYEDDSESDDDMQLEINDSIEEKKIITTNKAIVAEKYDATLDLSSYQYPTLDLLESHGSEKIVHDPTELETHKNQIIATLKNYDISIQRIAATIGPTVTLYEIVPAPGVRISRIKNLEDDIALSLAALGIRIIAPIPGKGTIGIEVPNIRKTVVSMKTLLASDKFINNNFSLPIAIGKKIDNENFIVDLASMPHLLMAGATGQGKSVGINTVLVSLLYKKHPSQLKFVLVDPKKVELSLYRVIEKHFLAKLPGEDEAIITDTKKVINTLNALCIEMDNRYDLLKEAHCRNIKEYNEKFTNRKLNPEKGHQYLPFIVLVVDEFADLIMTAGKEVEMPIARLAQLARAVGIHLIIATQRPSVNIITGTIKANFPARIAFKVSSKIDSRTILDAGGAEQLIGKGDMLISYNGEIVRLQCAFVDTPEVENVCKFIGDQRGYPQAFLLPEYIDEKDMDGREIDVNDRDPLFADAARLIVQNQVGSTSLIQRRMKLGYNRAGRLMDQLEAAGIVGPNLGSKAREVRFKTDVELENYLQSMG